MARKPTRSRKPRWPPETFSGYESFVYLLTELELVVGKGGIQWSPPAATAAMRRLERLAATMQSITTQIEQEQECPN